MMSLHIIDHNPSRGQLAVFALAWLAFFALLAAMAWWHDAAGWMPAALGAAAVAVPVIGAIVPGFLRLVYLGMGYATLPIGVVVSLVILLMVYYAVVTPIGLLLRLRGHDPLGRRFDPQARTYWVSRGESGDVGRYFKQF